MNPKRTIPFYHVDAFTDIPFSGNPAAVCLMKCDLDDPAYLSISSEMNLSETAFLEPTETQGHYHLRWFTPKVEVPLCGHATLASAHVIFRHLRTGVKKIVFQTKSGELRAVRRGQGVQLDFPSNDTSRIDPPAAMMKALQVKEWRDARYSKEAGKLLMRLRDSDEVRQLQPDFAGLLASPDPLGVKGIIVTAEGQTPYDFVSRYFAPWVGINEDPVTGSAHTVLAPYWAHELGKDEMRAYQVSSRGGELLVKIGRQRVYISGKAVTIIKGRMKPPTMS